MPREGGREGGRIVRRCIERREGGMDGRKKELLTVLDAVFLCHERLGVLLVQALVEDAF